MKITIKKYPYNEEYTVDLRRKDSIVYERGSMVCVICPWIGCPLTLRIAITPAGEILHRGWSWSGQGNNYLHLVSEPRDVNVTPEMIDTVGGLFSGRIKVDGLKVPVGGTVQTLCPVDISREEKLLGEKIYLA